MSATRGTRKEQKHPQMTASIVAGPLSLYDGREGGRTRSNNVGMELIIGVCCSLSRYRNGGKLEYPALMEHCGKNPIAINECTSLPPPMGGEMERGKEKRERKREERGISMIPINDAF